MGSFRELLVWQRAKNLAVAAYKIAEQLPDNERFGLKSQIQRAAVSIAANIAEGANRGSEREFARFLQIALGSSAELETLLLIAGEVVSWNLSEANALIAELHEVQRMIHGLIRSLSISKIKEGHGDYFSDDETLS